jgi:hypothetical protein
VRIPDPQYLKTQDDEYIAYPGRLAVKSRLTRSLARSRAVSDRAPLRNTPSRPSRSHRPAAAAPPHGEAPEAPPAHSWTASPAAHPDRRRPGAHALRNTSLVIPGSPATCAIGRPDSCTVRTPRKSSSGGYLRDLDITQHSPSSKPIRPGPGASTIPGCFIRAGLVAVAGREPVGAAVGDLRSARRLSVVNPTRYGAP